MKEWVVIIIIVKFVAMPYREGINSFPPPPNEGWVWRDCYGQGDMCTSGWKKEVNEFHVFKSSELAYTFEEGLYRGTHCDDCRVEIQERDAAVP